MIDQGPSLHHLLHPLRLRMHLRRRALVRGCGTGAGRRRRLDLAEPEHHAEPARRCRRGLGLPGVVSSTRSGRLYSSHDDGATWKDSDVERYPAAEHVSAVDFTDAQHGWIACASGALLATSDGGTTWTVHDTGTSAALNSVSFVDQAHGWASGTRYLASSPEYVVVRTSDGGDTWQTVSSLDCTSVDFVDSSHGWAVTGSDLCSTSDGGVTWTKVVTPGWQSGSPEFFDVSFADQSHGWALGYLYGYGAGYALYATDDGGATWTISPCPELGTAGLQTIRSHGSYRHQRWLVGRLRLWLRPRVHSDHHRRRRFVVTSGSLHRRQPQRRLFRQ